MKVCFVGLSAYSMFDSSQSRRQGGAEVQMYLLAREMALYPDMEISFVIGGDADIQNTTNDILLLQAHKIRESTFIVKKVISIWNCLTKSQADVFITTTKSNVSFIVSLYSLVYGKVHIHRTANDPDVDESYEKWPFYKRIIYRFVIKNASTVITQHHLHKKLLKLNYDKDSIVIKNGIEIPAKRDSDGMTKQGVLWVGRNVKAKQPDIMIQVCNKMPNVQFTIVCNDSNEPYIPRLQGQLTDLPNVIFHEYVQFESIQNLYDNARLFLSTSLHEGYPNTFIQAGMAGTPIISLHVNPDQMFDTRQCGIVVDGDVDLFIKTIYELLEDDRTFAIMSDSIYEYMIDNHSIKKNSKILRELLISYEHH